MVEVTARRGVDLNGTRLGNGRICRRGYRVSAFHNNVHNSLHGSRFAILALKDGTALPPSILDVFPLYACQNSATSLRG